MGRKHQPIRLGTLIPKVVDDLGVSGRLEEADVEAAWRQVAGSRIQAVTGRARFRDGRLVVHVTSATWRQALHAQREQWRSRINERLGADRVTELVFR